MKTIMMPMTGEQMSFVTVISDHSTSIIKGVNEEISKPSC